MPNINETTRVFLNSIPPAKWEDSYKGPGIECLDVTLAN